MESKNKILTATISLGALVVGIFIGIGVKGDNLQNNITSTKDKGYAECEKHKAMFWEGNLISTLGNVKAKKAIKTCKGKYSKYWNAKPTINECMGLKNNADKYGAKEFPNYLAKNKISLSNTSYCASNYPYMWSEKDVNKKECDQYKSFVDKGGNLTDLFSNGEIGGTLEDTCKNLIEWEEIE